METATYTIGEHQYEVRQLGAKQGLHTLARLTKLFGGATAAGATGDLAGAVEAVLSGMDPDELVQLAEVFAKHAKVYVVMQSKAGQTAVPVDLAQAFDTHFQGRYDELIEFCARSIELNFRSSLERGKGRLAGALASLGVASKSGSPSTSTGGSGGSSAPTASG